MSEQFRVEQALFGYRDGHNLIAASVTLSPQVRHFLATVTDGSGAESAEGFESAYTGLPVPETDFYAFFCTWPAPEMPRPGCVWSHLLLLDLADLARIPDLSTLPEFCIRPTMSSGFSNYEQPLTLTSRNAPLNGSVQIPYRNASILLAALYGQPDKSVVVLDKKSATWEPVIFALWSQQWPRLRRNFSFSTGSLGDRRSAGVSFDLQIAPNSSERLWRRGGQPAVVIDLSSDSFPDTSLPWVRDIFDDLHGNGISALRQFLFAFGSDVENPRHAFVSLAQVYRCLYLNQGVDWTEKLRFVAQTFPAPSSALRLKESLLSPIVADDLTTEDLEHAWAIVSFLLTTEDAQAYTMVSYDHSSLAPILWKEKRKNVLSLLGQMVHQRENSAATTFAATIASVVQPSELELISIERAELIPILLSHQPKLAFDSSTWRLPDYIQWQMTEVLNKLSLSPKEWGEIMGAKLIAATCIAVRDAVEKAGPYAIQGAFRWFDSNVSQEFFLPSPIWREALAAPAANRLRDSEPLSSASLALCAWLVFPETARQLLTASRQDVQQLAQQPLDLLPRPLRLPTAFLLVTLGLRASGPESVKLLKRGYFEVYEALAASTSSNIKFPWESWLLLSNELPEPGFWRDWDRCERLRRAVRKWLLRNVNVGNPLLDQELSKQRREIARETLSEEN